MNQLILCLFSATTLAAQSPRSDEAAIRAARARSNAAIAAHDANAVASVMDSDYLGLSSRNARTVGRQAARGDYTELFAARPGVVFVRTPRSFYTNARWGQAGESGNWTGRWSSPDGEVRVGGPYFAKWRKSGTQWKLLAETFVQTSCSGASYCSTPPVVVSPDSLPVTTSLTKPTIGVAQELEDPARRRPAFTALLDKRVHHSRANRRCHRAGSTSA